MTNLNRCGGDKDTGREGVCLRERETQRERENVYMGGGMSKRMCVCEKGEKEFVEEREREFVQE